MKEQSKVLSKITSGITTKYRFLHDSGYVVEVVLVERPEKNIICFSSTIGCLVGCKFCNAPTYYRSLTPDELNFQYKEILKDIKNNNKILASFMGVGDITFNPYCREIIKSFSKQCSKLAFSTAVPKISFFYPVIRFIFNNNLTNIKIQLSLHAIKESDRDLIFGTYLPLENIEIAIRIMNELEFKNFEINYFLIDGINDTDEHALDLVNRFGQYYIKLNRYNPTRAEFKTSKREKEFLDILLSRGVKAELYATDGQDIQATCGQLICNLV